MTLRLLGVATLATVTSGCLTITTRLRSGPTLDSTGKAGWEVGVALGFGYSTSNQASLRGLAGAGVSDRGAGLGAAIEYGAIERAIAWHAGFAGELATSEDEVVRSLYGAAMRPLWFDADSSSEEKFSLVSHTRRALSVGVEARAGLVVEQGGESRGLFALMPVLDLTMMASE